MSTVVAPTAERRELGAVADRELVAAVRAGDDRAFERLYERYHRRIAAYVYGMVNDYGRAEDITQEVFISALRRMRQTERPIAFKPWLYEIAKNACIDQFRRTRRAEEVSFDAEDGAALEHSRLTAFEGGPHDAVDAKLQLDNLCGAFGGLSETHHQILVMREFEGLSYAEIGDRLGLSRPSVESTLFRARRRLSEEYDELASGARCQRVHDIIVSARSKLGARDQRRLLRHVAHCQPCRREARLAGLQVGSLSRHPVRDAVAAKVAGVLPFPFLLRGRRGSDASQPDPGFVANLSSQISAFGEPLTGWTKAAAAAAMVAVAGAGAAGVTGVVGSGTKDETAISAKPAAEQRKPASQPERSPSQPSAGTQTTTSRDAAKPQPRRQAASTAPARAGLGLGATATAPAGQSAEPDAGGPAAAVLPVAPVGHDPAPDADPVPRPDPEASLPRVVLPASDKLTSDLSGAASSEQGATGTLTDTLAGALAGGG